MVNHNCRCCTDACDCLAQCAEKCCYCSICQETIQEEECEKWSLDGKKKMTTKMEAARDAAIQKLWEPFIDSQSPLATSYVEYQRAMELGYAAGYDARGSQWVAVSERLPTLKGKYLLTWESVKTPGEMHVSLEYFDLVQFSSYGITVGQPIAWMPLPKPYTADSGQEGE